MSQMHGDCYDKFAWLIQYRLDFGLKNGILKHVLYGMPDSDW